MAETAYTHWHQAEIARSDCEARNTATAGLLYGEGQIERYMAPPLDSVFSLEYAYALLAHVAGKRVLDLGCGSGENSFLLAKRGADVIGVDLSASLIALAERRVALNGGTEAPVRFLCASAHHLPIPDGSIDVVFGMAVLHHVDLDQTAAEVYRVLRPGGLAIFKEPVRDSKVLMAARKCIPYQAPDVSPFERPLTSGEIARFSARFETRASRSFLLPFVSAMQMLPVPVGWRARSYRLDGALLSRFAGLSRYASVRVFALAK